MSQGVRKRYDVVNDLIESEDYDQAKERIEELRCELRGSTKELERMERLIDRIQLIGA